MADKKKVLIFEDNSAIQSLLKFFFQRRGTEVHIESDGTQAVPLALSYGPDLIIMDYIMPGRDGVEAIADLRRMGVETPIVVLTSKSFPADLERARKAGATNYLIKPFDPAQLEAAVKPFITD